MRGLKVEVLINECQSHPSTLDCGCVWYHGISAYLNTVAEEIDEALQAAGRLVVSDLYKRFSLPLEFLNQIIDARLGQTIYGQRDASDGNALYTPTYVARQRAVVRGAGLAVTRCVAEAQLICQDSLAHENSLALLRLCRPTPVASLAAQHGIDLELFLELLEGHLADGVVQARLRGARDKAVLVPEVYQRTQAAAAVAFYRQNSYIGTQRQSCTGQHEARADVESAWRGVARRGVAIELDTLRKLEIDNARAVLAGADGSDAAQLLLSTCYVAPSMVDQLDAAIEEAVGGQGWLNPRVSPARHNSRRPRPCISSG